MYWRSTTRQAIYCGRNTISSDDDTTLSSEQLISATVRPKDVEATDRCSVISRCLIATKTFIKLAENVNQSSLFALTTLYSSRRDSAISIERVNIWPEMPILFIRSRESPLGRGLPRGRGSLPGGPRKLWKLPFFPCASFGTKIGPLATKIREINSILGAPLPLRSMEIENFRRRYLRYLKR